jgi:hypothetical protein
LRRVAEVIEREQLLRSGDFLALVGNVAAASARERYIDDDLNRLWSLGRVDSVKKGEFADSAEDKEQRDLLHALHSGFDSARGPVVFLDLHTTSGPGGPFCVFADTLRSRSFARRFPLPAVLGLEENLAGTLVDYVGHIGHVAVGFEGGQHDEDVSVENLESVIWIALGELGMIDPSKVEFVRGQRERLSLRSKSMPRYLEVVYRHAIGPGARFRMRTGFRGFDRVTKGQVVASDGGGDVLAPESGFLLMPLYQRQGDDGFFVTRRVFGFWLAVSAGLRHARVGRIVHWLPGISRDPLDPQVLYVDRRVARVYSLELLHLLGFRRRSLDGDILTVERRQHDLS